MQGYPEECPDCAVSLIGEPIPEEYKHMYGPELTYYYRVIGIYSLETDRTTKWRCPDCHYEWERK